MLAVSDLIVAALVIWGQMALLNQAYLSQSCQRTVDGGQTDIGVARFGLAVYPLGIQVCLALVQHFQDGAALRRLLAGAGD